MNGLTFLKSDAQTDVSNWSVSFLYISVIQDMSNEEKPGIFKGKINHPNLNFQLQAGE